MKIIAYKKGNHENDWFPEFPKTGRANIADGAGAFIVTSAERAKDLKKPPVYLMGAGEGHTHEYICGVTGDLATFGTKQSGKGAFEMAGVSPKNIDVAEIYDPFTIEGLINLECLVWLRNVSSCDRCTLIQHYLLGSEREIR